MFGLINAADLIRPYAIESTSSAPEIFIAPMDRFRLVGESQEIHQPNK